MTPARTDTAACADCGASVVGCTTVQLLRGRRCCVACLGDHDAVVRRRGGRAPWPTPPPTHTTPDTTTEDTNR